MTAASAEGFPFVREPLGCVCSVAGGWGGWPEETREGVFTLAANRRGARYVYLRNGKPEKVRPKRQPYYIGSYDLEDSSKRRFEGYFG